MKKIKHTPGPWLVEREVDGAGADDSDYEALTFVTKIGPFHIDWHDDLNKTKADRIEADIACAAAAPDLLEALRNMDEAMCRGFDSREDRNFGRKALIAARAAIAKATGVDHV